MEEFFKSISNREYATFFIVASFFLYFFIKSVDTRKAMLDILKTLFGSKLILLFAFPFIYLVLITFAMYKLSIWDSSLLKDSILSLFYGMVVVGKSINTDNFKLMYKEYFLSYISFAYLFEFVIGTYDFNFFVEILFVLFVSLLLLTNTYLEHQKDAPQNTKKLLNNTLAFIGFFVVLHCFRSFCISPERILNLHSLQVLWLPIIYAIALIPLCYFIWIYCKYESMLCSLFVVNSNLKYNISKIFIAFKTFRLCGVDIERLKLWQHFFLLNYKNYNKTPNIDEFIAEFKLRYTKIKTDNLENEIDITTALDFMSQSNYPKVSYKYVAFSDGFGNYQALSYNKQNSLKYYCINGNQENPQLFILYDFVLNIQNLDNEIMTFENDCQILHYKIFTNKMNKKYRSKIKKLKPFNYSQGIYNISFLIDKDVNDRILSLTFKIYKKNPIEFCDFELQNGLVN